MSGPNETPRGNLAEINQMEISTTHMNRSYDLEFLGKPVQITLGEIVAAVSAFYLICIASFNAGYFSSVKGRFVLLGREKRQLFLDRLSSLVFIGGNPSRTQKF